MAVSSIFPPIIFPQVKFPSTTCTCRYDHALSKANYASLALRPQAEPAGGGDGDGADAGPDEDEDLYQSLNK